MILKNNGHPLFLPPIIKNSLPLTIYAELEEAVRRVGRDPEEIRIRLKRREEFVFSGTSILGESILDEKEISEIFYRLCGTSVYAHTETIREGFIKAEGGIRIGVCGSASLKGQGIEAVHDISSINIRLPCKYLPDVRRITETFLICGGGMLLFSPPGEGKTTVLKSLINDISGVYGKRSAVVDTRSELATGLSDKELRADILDGYPRGLGIEIAVRSMNPQVIFCDEIGSGAEAKAILSARNCGVPIIASAHGRDVKELVRRDGIEELHRAGIFSNYVKIERNADKYSFEIFPYHSI
ncbi:MAG: hypothetical protein U0M06_13740 [Clostridia bacterium]|nr:hypothetical protein [Clostridia bacterium]